MENESKQSVNNLDRGDSNEINNNQMNSSKQN